MFVKYTRRTTWNVGRMRDSKGKQEGHKIPTECKQKVNKMLNFVLNFYKQSTNDVLKINVFYFCSLLQ